MPQNFQSTNSIQQLYRQIVSGVTNAELQDRLYEFCHGKCTNTEVALAFSGLRAYRVCKKIAYLNVAAHDDVVSEVLFSLNQKSKGLKLMSTGDEGSGRNVENVQGFLTTVIQRDVFSAVRKLLNESKNQVPLESTIGERFMNPLDEQPDQQIDASNENEPKLEHDQITGSLFNRFVDSFIRDVEMSLGNCWESGLTNIERGSNKNLQFDRYPIEALKGAVEDGARSINPFHIIWCRMLPHLTQDQRSLALFVCYTLLHGKNQHVSFLMGLMFNESVGRQYLSKFKRKVLHIIARQLGVNRKVQDNEESYRTFQLEVLNALKESY